MVQVEPAGTEHTGVNVGVRPPRRADAGPSPSTHRPATGRTRAQDIGPPELIADGIEGTRQALQLIEVELAIAEQRWRCGRGDHRDDSTGVRLSGYAFATRPARFTRFSRFAGCGGIGKACALSSWSMRIEGRRSDFACHS